MKRSAQMKNAGVPVATKFSKHNGFRKEWKPGSLIYERPVAEACAAFLQTDAKAANAILGWRSKELIKSVFDRARAVVHQLKLAGILK